MFSTIAAVILAVVFAVGASVLPSLFTDDRAVLDAIGVPWWFMVAQLPIAGIVFALDGVLLGAGDAAGDGLGLRHARQRGQAFQPDHESGSNPGCFLVLKFHLRPS